MKHTLALFGSAFLLAGCSETEKPPEPRPVAWVEVGASETTSDDQVTFPARVRAEQRASLSFEVGGTLTSVRAEIGDRVGRGAVVATLDSATYRFNAASADAQVVETRARLARARQEAERQRALFAEGATSETRLETADAEVNSLEALLDAGQAQAGSARETLSDTRLRAPFSGRVARRIVEPGTPVSPGQPVLELDGFGTEVVFSVPGTLRDRLATGQSVEVLRPGRDVPALAATITEISSRGSGPGAFEIVARVMAGEGTIEPGEVAEVRLSRDAGNEEPRPQSATYAIPLTAIMPTGPDRGEVWVVDTQTDKVSARTIRFEAASENRVTVTSGLKSGDVVVSKGAAFLQTGERVSLIGAGARRFAS